MNFVRSNYLIALVLLTTLVKGVAWAYVVPPFQAPDEQVHYAEIQHYAEPAGYAPQSYDFPLGKTSLFDIKTQNLSPELKDYLERADFEKTRFDRETKTDFINHLPFRDDEPAEHLSRFVEKYPAWLTNYPPLYYQAGAVMENAFSGWGVAEKSFFLRLFSVFLTAIFVLAAYLLFRELNLARSTAALLAGTVSFQPMLTFIASYINVDAFLFTSFGLFLWGSVRVIRKNPEWIGLTALIAGTTLSALAKPSGYFAIFTLPALAVILVLRNYEKIVEWDKNKKISRGFLAGTMLSGAIAVLYFFYQAEKARYFAGSQALLLLPAYILHQLEYPVFLIHSLYYWGNFAWLSMTINPFFIHVIWVVLALAFIGILKYFWQKPKEKTKFYQTVFLVFMVGGFFLMIHAVNFQQVNPNNVADETNAIAIQGRYFFPVMAAKFYLIYLGLTVLFKKIRPRTVAWLLFLSMVTLNLTGLIFYIIPRYYF